ncbi:hypothetical protein [Staphylococcus phage PT1-4]
MKYLVQYYLFHHSLYILIHHCIEVFHSYIFNSGRYSLPVIL